MTWIGACFDAKTVMKIIDNVKVYSGYIMHNSLSTRQYSVTLQVLLYLLGILSTGIHCKDVC